MEVLTVILLFLILPMIQELIHCIIPVGIRVSASEFDINYDVSMALP